MEVGQGPNVGCSAKGKKKYFRSILYQHKKQNSMTTVQQVPLIQHPMHLMMAS
jgi:hypothetical protein